MIDLGLYLAFIAAVAVLMAIPGPNVALIVANSVAHGTRYGLLTVAGTSAAMVLQLVLVALGMTPLLGALGAWFELLRWIGVAYLFYLGIKAWRAPAVDLTTTKPERKSSRRMFSRALLVSMTNPKTLLFYGAADFCLVTDRSLTEVQVRLDVCGVPVELGPVRRIGAQGEMTSLYFRDPDGNLIEVSAYDR